MSSTRYSPLRDNTAPPLAEYYICVLREYSILYTWHAVPSNTAIQYFSSIKQNAACMPYIVKPRYCLHFTGTRVNRCLNVSYTQRIPAASPKWMKYIDEYSYCLYIAGMVCCNKELCNKLYLEMLYII